MLMYSTTFNVISLYDYKGATLPVSSAQGVITGFIALGRDRGFRPCVLWHLLSCIFNKMCLIRITP